MRQILREQLPRNFLVAKVARKLPTCREKSGVSDGLRECYERVGSRAVSGNESSGVMPPRRPNDDRTSNADGISVDCIQRTPDL